MSGSLIAAAVDLAVSFVAACEGCRLSAYYPTPDDRPTIGYGATYHLDGSPVRMGEVIPQAAADAMLRASLGLCAAKVAVDAGFGTTARQLAAMTSLAFNIGEPAFAGSTVLRLHRAGDHAGAAAAFGMWTKQAGKVLPGLVNRRRKEAALYLGAKR